MPFFNPFKFFLGDQGDIIKADIDSQVDVLAQLMRLVMIELFVFVFIAITEG